MAMATAIVVVVRMMAITDKLDVAFMIRALDLAHRFSSAIRVFHSEEKTYVFNKQRKDEESKP